VARPDLYISADIETDGPIPGPYSMLSFGLAVAGRYDGEQFVRRDPAVDTLYHELKPISQEYEEEALEVNGLDRARLAEVGEEPSEANEAYAHLRLYTEIAPFNGWAWCWLGQAAAGLGAREEARAAYARALELEDAGGFETDASELLQELSS
jgi:tetratricopeptide (TPR) repeat protein